MADSFTANYNLTKPQIGLSDATWGDKLNANWDAIDLAVKNTYDNLPLASQGLAVKGMILLWSGSIYSVPAGWQICDGSNGTPDLRDRFIAGVGANPIGSIGGSVVTSMLPSHSHSIAPDAGHTHQGASGTSLGPEHLPIHNHGGGQHTHNQFKSSMLADVSASPQTLVAYGALSTSSVSTLAVTPNLVAQGSGLPHSHAINSSDSYHVHSLTAAGSHSHNAIPPFYALAFIMKL